MRVGVFDSGLGGLTVVRELRRLSPGVDILYLGDTARVPYGTKSNETVRRYSAECAAFLEKQGVDALVVACNTASALALESLRRDFRFPVFGVIEPGAREAIRASGGRSIGVLGTAATVDSGAYGHAVHAIDAGRALYSQAAPLLVPLVEEGWTQGDVPRQVIRHYLGPLLEHEIGALILGCTHYPLLREVIQDELEAQRRKTVAIVDSGVALARELRSLVEGSEAAAAIGTQGRAPGALQLFVTDAPRKFQNLAERFLGEAVGGISPISLSH